MKRAHTKSPFVRGRIKIRPTMAAVSTLLALAATGGQPAWAQDSEGPTLRVASLNVPEIAPVHGASLQDGPLQNANLQISEAAARIEAALSHPINADYFNITFGEVLNDLSTQAEVPIILDQAATNKLKYRIGQDSVGVFTTPIILKAEGLPLRSVLDLILPGLGLTWGIKSNETISVTTPRVAEQWVQDRLYPVEKILANNPSSVANPKLGAQVIGDFVTTFVAPESWQINGGMGEIVPLDNALLVRATRHVQAEVSDFLGMWADPSLRQPQPSPAENEIRSALGEEIIFDAPEQALYEVLPDLADRTNIPIVLDFYALLAARIPYDQPVGFNVAGVSLGAVLDLMLDPQNLTAVIYKDALLVTTKRRAAELMSVRMYNVRDLLVPPAEEASAPLDQRTLTTILDATVQPDNWFTAGGEARKELYVSDNADEVLLIVRQTDSGHRDLAERLKQLREWKSTQ